MIKTLAGRQKKRDRYFTNLIEKVIDVKAKPLSGKQFHLDRVKQFSTDK